MHYKNGRRAHPGDLVVHLAAGRVATGILHSVMAESQTYNGRIATSGSHDPYVNVNDCLHVDDIVAASIPDGTAPKSGPPEHLDPGVARVWSDEQGPYWETYGGHENVVHTDSNGRFIWNEGPPRRRNHLGEGASPIEKRYLTAEEKAKLGI